MGTIVTPSRETCQPTTSSTNVGTEKDGKRLTSITLVPPDAMEKSWNPCRHGDARYPGSVLVENGRSQDGVCSCGVFTPQKQPKKSRENRSMFHGFRTYPAWSPSVKQQNIRKATKRIGADRWVDASWHGGHISSWLVSGPPLNNSYTLCKVGCQKTPPQKTYDPAFKTIPHLSI